jgi:hypothetical protein
MVPSPVLSTSHRQRSKIKQQVEYSLRPTPRPGDQASDEQNVMDVNFSGGRSATTLLSKSAMAYALSVSIFGIGMIALVGHIARETDMVGHTITVVPC